MCGGERPLLLHHRVTWQLLCGKEEGAAEGGESCTKDYGTHPVHYGHLHLQMQEAGLPTHTARTLFVPPSPQAGGCGALREGPPD